MRKVEEIIKLIQKLYEKDFGGKDRGRFYISADLFRDLADRKRIEESFKNQIINEAYETGLVITDHGDGYSVIEESVMLSYRKTTKNVIAELLKFAKDKK